MEQVELDLDRQAAGADYLLALKRLGLVPEALFWTFDRTEERFVLVLATDMFDFKGPLAVTELLFKAYDVAATPKAIDPFVVRLHSPQHDIIRALDQWRISDPDRVAHLGLVAEQQGLPIAFATLNLDFGDMHFRSAWVYRFSLRQRKTSVELGRKWKRFSQNVNRLAA